MRKLIFSALLLFASRSYGAFKTDQLTVTGLTAGQCVQTTTGGLLTVAGAPCGSGSGGGSTTATDTWHFPYGLSASTFDVTGVMYVSTLNVTEALNASVLNISSAITINNDAGTNKQILTSQGAGSLPVWSSYVDISSATILGTLDVVKTSGGGSGGGRLKFNPSENSNTPTLHISQENGSTPAMDMLFETLGSSYAYIRANSTAFRIGATTTNSTGNAVDRITMLFNGSATSFQPSLQGYGLSPSSMTFIGPTSTDSWGILDWSRQDRMRLWRASFETQYGIKTSTLEVINLSPGTAYIVSGSSVLSTGLNTLGCTIDGGGSAISALSTGTIIVPYDCAISTWTIISPSSGSITIDIRRTAFSTYVGTTTSIVGAGTKPFLTTSFKNGSAPSSWTSTTLSANDILEFLVTSATTTIKAIVQLGVRRQ